MEYILFMIGFIFLIKGADLFVEGSCNLARFLKVPSVIIGLTIVAMGTSAPEASVSIRAAFTGNNEIALSNIIGSNIFNIFLMHLPDQGKASSLFYELDAGFVPNVICTLCST